MEFGVRFKKSLLFILAILSFIFVLTSCSNKNSYSGVERDFIAKHSDFFWKEENIEKELCLYQYEEYYFYFYSFVKNDTGEEFERVSMWELSKNMNGVNMYKEKAHIYLMPYDLSSQFPEEYQLYLNAKKLGLIKEYTADEIEKIKSSI